MVSQRKRAARAAAKRIPLVGTAVVVAPVIKAAVNSGLNLSTISQMATWQSFLNELKSNFTEPARLAETYVPIAAYLAARRFAGRHISRVLRPLGVKF